MGNVLTDKEYNQFCKKCKIPAKPTFDEEATGRAINVVMKAIQKRIYGIYPETGESSKHSRANERKKNHDSKNCEACQLGKCSFGDDFYRGFSGLGIGSRPNPPDYSNATKSKPISWVLMYHKKYINA